MEDMEDIFFYQPVAGNIVIKKKSLAIALLLRKNTSYKILGQGIPFIGFAKT